MRKILISLGKQLGTPLASEYMITGKVALVIEIEGKK